MVRRVLITPTTIDCKAYPIRYGISVIKPDIVNDVLCQQLLVVISCVAYIAIMVCTVCDNTTLQSESAHLGFPSDFEKSIIKKILEAQGITEEETIVASGSNKGDNYSGVILKVRSHATKDGKHVNFNFVYKTAPTSDEARNRGYCLFLFDREFLSYETLLPALEELQNIAAIPTRARFNHPKCYETIHAVGHEGIVMEDLCPRGYATSDRFGSLDWAQVQLLLTNLAKLHGLSYAMKARDPDAFSALAESAVEVFTLMPNYKDSSLLRKNGFLDLAFQKALNSLHNPEHVKLLSNLANGIEDKFLYLLSPQAAGETAVICHGDTWTNNVLFKYNEVNEVIDVRLIDWQMARYASPLTDVMYMIWTSTHGGFRRKYYEKAFEHYHSSLGKFLEGFSLNVEDFYPRKNFIEDRKKFAPCSLYATFFLQSFITAGAGDTSTVSIEELRDKVEDGTSFVAEPSNALFVERVNEISVDYIHFVLESNK